MPKGNTLFLYTDGLTEAQNARGEEYGEERLRDVLGGKTGLSPVQLADMALKDLKAFCRDTPRRDDLTVMVLRRAA